LEKNSPEFVVILSRVEEESLVDVESDVYENPVNEKDFFKTIVYFSSLRFNRMIQ